MKTILFRERVSLDDRVFPFGGDALRGALAHLAEGHPFGKVVIDLEAGR